MEAVVNQDDVNQTSCMVVSGMDLLIYNVAESSGAHDCYDGGVGIDTICFEMTLAEANTYQTAIQRAFTMRAPDSRVDLADFTSDRIDLTIFRIEKLNFKIDAPIQQDNANFSLRTALTGYTTVLTSNPNYGEVTINQNIGTLSYVIANNCNCLSQGIKLLPLDSFSYAVLNASGETLATATVNVII